MNGTEHLKGFENLISADQSANLHGFEDLLQYQGRYDWSRITYGRPEYELRIWLTKAQAVQNAEKEYRLHQSDVQRPEYIELLFLGVSDLLFVPSVLPLVFYKIRITDISSKQKQGAAYSFTSDVNVGPSDELPPRFICDCHAIYLVEYGHISVFGSLDAAWTNSAVPEA